MTRCKLKPRDGLKVRGPNKEWLPADGKEVPLSSFWVRRLIAGDVVRVPDASRAVTATATKGEDE